MYCMGTTQARRRWRDGVSGLRETSFHAIVHEEGQHATLVGARIDADAVGPGRHADIIAGLPVRDGDAIGGQGVETVVVEPVSPAIEFAAEIAQLSSPEIHLKSRISARISA